MKRPRGNRDARRGSGSRVRGRPAARTSATQKSGNPGVAAGRRGTRGTSTRSLEKGVPPRPVAAADAEEIESLRKAIARVAETSGPPRWNASPDDVQRSVIQLVLTLVEFIRRVLERQAIRRMEARTLTRAQTEAIGTALMRLEDTIRDIGAQFNLSADDLKLDLGPVGRLM